MTKQDQELLDSLHPLLDDDLIALHNPELKITRISCCFLLRSVDPDLNRTIKLNDTGALVWSLCTDQRTVGDICDLIAESYGVGLDEIKRDISRVIGSMLEEEALVLPTDN